ncbi:MAG: hypothetical protein NZ518_05220, partial [Dehalococcoidia bacterium]|nr:hypothetical protein [Dehalococcoidia bacterium]
NALCAQCGLPPEADPEDLRDRLNLLFWPTPDADYGRLLTHVPYPPDARAPFPHPASVAAFRAAARQDRSYYVANVRYGTFVDECDVLANALAVLTDTPSADRAERVMAHLVAAAVEPYPARSWTTTFGPGSDRYRLLNLEAERHQAPRWRNPPGRYHNGAVWPFIGGWVVCALAHVGWRDAAQAALERLAAANALNDWGFPEWIDATTGEPGGAVGQAWNAGSYVAAYQAVQGQRFVW